MKQKKSATKWDVEINVEIGGTIDQVDQKNFCSALINELLFQTVLNDAMNVYRAIEY